MLRPNDRPDARRIPGLPPRVRAFLRKRRWPLVGVACAILLSVGLYVGLRGPSTGDAGVTADAFVPDAGVDAGPVAKLQLHGPRRVEGLVQDDLGAALADALIRVSSAQTPAAQPREVRSDAEGRFRVDDLPVEVLNLEVSRIGHEGKEHTLHADDAAQLTFVLARQGELAVALRDTPGQRVDGAEIVVTGPGLWPAQAAHANERGEHVFKGLAAGEYRVRARHGLRIAPSSEALAVVPGERTSVELVLREGARLRGSVVDQQTGKPIARAQVSIQDLTPGIDAYGVTTDGTGAFEAGGLWPGAARIDVQREGYAPATRDVTLPLDESLEILLAGAAAIGGVVVDEDGQPIVGARLSVTTREGLPIELNAETKSADGAGELGVTRGPIPTLPLFGSPADSFALGTLAADSDRAGRFRIAELAPRPLIVHAVRTGYVPARLPIDTLEPHEEKSDLKIVLRAAGKVVGRIVDARGRPLSAVYVAAHASDGEQSSITDARGDFVIAGVVGEVTVEAQPDGHTTLRCRTKVAPRGEARCDLTATTAVHELPVRVVDEYGIALEGAVVTLTAGGTHTSTQVSRRDGTLRLRELPPPPYQLRVALPGRLSAELAVESAEREVVIRLGRAATLAGFVTDSLGRAVPSALVSTTGNEDLSAETDARGAFTLEDVPPGPHTLAAQHPTAGRGRAPVVRARPSERHDGLRIVLSGRYVPVDAGTTAPVRRGGAAADEARARPKSEPTIEQRGRMMVLTHLPATSPLAKAGLRVGDVLLAVDDEAPLSAAHARGLLRDPPGRSAVIRVLRGKRPVNLRYRRPAP